MVSLTSQWNYTAPHAFSPSLLRLLGDSGPFYDELITLFLSQPVLICCCFSSKILFHCYVYLKRVNKPCVSGFCLISMMLREQVSLDTWHMSPKYALSTQIYTYRTCQDTKT